jgi:hypothetical protein
LELVPVESMDQVFDFALSKVIVPQRSGSGFLITAEEPEAEEEEPPMRTVGRKRIGLDDYE